MAAEAAVGEQDSMPENIRIRPGVKAIIWHQGKVLFISEKLKNGEGKIIVHDVPGGGIEQNESMMETLRREVYEEVGLKVEVICPVGGWELTLLKYNESIRAVCFAYLCKLSGSTQVDLSNNPAQEDIFSAEWLSIDEALNRPNFITNADMRKTLENCRKLFG